MKAGFKINVKKSILPIKVVNNFGFQLNFQKGKLQVPPQKVKSTNKELGIILRKTFPSKRKPGGGDWTPVREMDTRTVKFVQEFREKKSTLHKNMMELHPGISL